MNGWILERILRRRRSNHDGSDNCHLIKRDVELMDMLQSTRKDSHFSYADEQASTGGTWACGHTNNNNEEQVVEDLGQGEGRHSIVVEEDSLLNYQNLYRATTEELGKMDPGGVTPESEPLTFQEVGSTHSSRQGRTFAWALFFSALAVSALVAFVLLAIVLELNGGLFNTPDSDSFIDPNTINFTDTTHLPETLTNVKFPLVDVRTAEQNDFMDTIGPNQKPSGVTSPPFIVIPTSQQANASQIAHALSAATFQMTSRDALELSLNGQGYTLKPGAASALYSVGQRFSSMDVDARSRAGFMMNIASQWLAQELNLTSEEAVRGIVMEATADDFQPHQFCPNSTAISSCNPADEYRSYDGVCNNLHHEHWGATSQPFRRILYPTYDDGISSPRKSSNKTALPNPRVISKVILQDLPTGTSGVSTMLTLWAQFVNHDIALTAPSTSINATSVPCCVKGQLVTPQHPECLPLSIPHVDPAYANGVTCMNFVRSAPAPACVFGPREQFNQITSYLDASTVYGSTLAEGEAIRTAPFGFTTMLNHGRIPTAYVIDGRPLPQQSKGLDDGCNRPELLEERKLCFKSGDKRINEYFGMTSLNLIWIRQHNLITEQLAILNPTWDEKKTFQEARRILIAQVQHITYSEFLPLLIGNDLMTSAGLALNPSGYYEGYDPEVEATISNSFATAAFRFGHSMIQALTKLVGPHWKNEDYTQLYKLLNNPFKMYELGGMDLILRGHMSMTTGKAGLHMSGQMTDHLFQLANGTSGYDLAAMDIQRGRDHGIPSYVEWRAKCGLKSLQNFSEFNAIWTEGSATRIAAVYRTVEDIDLYVGGLAESPLPGAVVGPTFACIIADQFLRLRKGDRFWYENSIQIKPFTAPQLAMIRKTTLARIICDNSDAILMIPSSPMKALGGSNALLPCSSPSFPLLSYEQWEENNLVVKKLEFKPVGEDSLEGLYSSEEEVDEEDINKKGHENNSSIPYVNIPILEEKAKNKTKRVEEPGFVDSKDGRILRFG